MDKVVIVAAKRSPIGSFGGSLKDMHVASLAAKVAEDALSSIALEKKHVDEVILGNVLSAGLGQNIARQLLLGIGIKQEARAFCVNHVCGSGMKALHLAYQSIALGESEVVLAGGVENMSSAPFLAQGARFGYKMGHQELKDSIISDGLWCAINDYHMGITAENLAWQYKLSRQEQDEFALSSQLKASKAQKEGRFKDEITPINIPSKKGEILFENDEYIKHESSIEVLSKLKPAFKKDGSVTAGNASGINDGAAILVLMSETKAKDLNLKILAHIESFGSVGVDPSIMGIGPAGAIEIALKRAHISLKDIELIEANEAFAAQSLSVVKEAGLDLSLVNVNGGAIALGHPIGASGARIVVSLIYEMIKRNNSYGLATLCIGGGQGIAMIIKRSKT